jgi:hypothetical protein
MMKHDERPHLLMTLLGVLAIVAVALLHQRRAGSTSAAAGHARAGWITPAGRSR